MADKRSELELRLIDIAAMSNLTVPTIRLIESGSGTIGAHLKILKSYDLQLSGAGLGNALPYGNSLAQRRQRVGISQRRMAEQIGVSQGTIIGLEVGKNMDNVNNRHTLLQFYS
ncbi:MAG: hypothetical protein COA52_15940 [Hyphomicrobiales bacterium]|nr:MAG: hypothetical protein COA52_15940 [Hyphomicrobiales bacterium]